MQSNILTVALLLLLKLNSAADVKFVDIEKIRKSDYPKACIPVLPDCLCYQFGDSCLLLIGISHLPEPWKTLNCQPSQLCME